MGDAEKALDLHVSIVGTEPEIWRDLRVPAAARLSDLHAVIQRAFGWMDAHLHVFSARNNSGRRLFTGDEESALELEMEMDNAATLDEVLGGSGSTLEYEYDLGDGWRHEIAVTGHAVAPAGTFTCLAGANSGPIEDSGGVGGYAEKCEILADENHPEHAEIAEWYTIVTGRPASAFDPSAFDIAAVNRRLDRFSLVFGAVPPTAEEMVAVVRPAKWLLERAGKDGLELTKDGYLKPALVAELLDSLDWYEPWMGTAKREANMPHVRELRARMQEWKLLRKYKGRLVRTPAARKINDDAALWEHLVSAMAQAEYAALDVTRRLAVHWLLEDRTPPWNVVGDVVAQMLTYEGFRMPDGTPVPEDEARMIYRDAARPFEILGVFEGNGYPLGAEGTSAAGLKFLADVRRRQEAD